MGESSASSELGGGAQLALLRVLADRLPAMLAYWDANLRCRYANRAYETWFGVTAESMIGRDMEEFLGPLFQLNLPYIQGALRGETQEFERLIPDPHGGPPRHSQASYLPDIRDGRVEGFCVLVVDITRRKLAEEALQVAERRLHAVERLTAIATLAAGIGHEINNPLTAVLGNLELALQELETDQPGSERVIGQLTTARQSAQHIAEIVESMKLLARGDTTQTSAVDLDATIRRSVKLASTTRYRTRIALDLQANGHVTANASQLAQVWVNLLVNAAQCFPEPVTQDDNLVSVRSFRRDDQLIVEVRDNGPGIPEALQTRIFEPFFSTKESGAGTGLGLAISRSIVSAFGGTLSVDSKIGQGSTFRVALPTATSPAANIETAPTAAQYIAARTTDKPRVLVVDDEESLRALIAFALRDRNQIRCASSAAEGLAMLEALAGDVDLIVCDLMMPGRGGAELYVDVCERWPELAERFVFMTGGAFTREGRAFLDQTKAPVLDKPFSMQTLRALIEERIRAPKS